MMNNFLISYKSIIQNCYEEGHNLFLGYSPIHIFSSLLKKNKYKKIKKYNSEKRMPERSENSQNLVEV